MKKLNLFVFTILLPLAMSAQTFIHGGQFKDRILPMQGSQTKSAAEVIWGASGVQGRFLDNGAEPATLSSGKPDVSYWGGNIVKDSEGLYHMFLAGWDATQYGHNSWPQSDVYHVTSPNYWGPYNLTSDYNIGKGHNPRYIGQKTGHTLCMFCVTIHLPQVFNHLHSMVLGKRYPLISSFAIVLR